MSSEAVMESCLLSNAPYHFVPSIGGDSLCGVAIRLGAKEEASSDFSIGTFFQIEVQKDTGSLSIHHHPPPPIFGNLWPDGDLLMGKDQVTNLQCTQLAPTQSSIVGQKQHEP